MTGLRGRIPFLRLGLALALLIAAAALALPWLAERAIARRLTQAAAARGLVARWATLEVRFPARVAIGRLRVVSEARGDLVMSGESLAVAVDPLSLLLFHPRARAIELRHVFARGPRAGGADPDTLAPEEDPRRVDRSEKVRRAAEGIARTLLVPARRLPRIELRDVRLATGEQEDEPGAGLELDWLDLRPAPGGVVLAGAGRLAGAREVPFDFRARYGDDDRVEGGARFGVFDAATGRTTPLRFAVEGRLVQDRGAGRVEFAGPTRVSVGQVPILLTCTLARRGPRLDLELQCDDLTGERIVASLPHPLLGRLLDVGVAGSWDYRLGLRLDLERPDSVEFHADVIPHGLALDPERTRLNLLTLDQPFVAEIHLPRGRVATRDLSAENPRFRRLEAIDSILVHAVLTNEDGAFFRHRGFNAEAMKGAIADDIRAGAYRRGAGTITMQLVRNLYLGHERTLSRKAQEIALAWMLEHLTYVTKRRLLEIYLNIIEWGPGVHGADEAARYYFGRDASRLTVDQALFLATVIPAPTKWRYRFDPAGELRPFERAQMHFIGRAMVKKGWLSADELPPADSLRVEIAGPAREMLARETAKDSTAS
ncbi:MAG TPA: biosynthetic peptidoglycan transglycosylase [Candidatus Eisenbacteria bacterium]